MKRAKFNKPSSARYLWLVLRYSCNSTVTNELKWQQQCNTVEARLMLNGTMHIDSYAFRSTSHQPATNKQAAITWDGCLGRS